MNVPDTDAKSNSNISEGVVKMEREDAAPGSDCGNSNSRGPTPIPSVESHTSGNSKERSTKFIIAVSETEFKTEEELCSLGRKLNLLVEIQCKDVGEKFSVALLIDGSVNLKVAIPAKNSLLAKKRFLSYVKKKFTESASALKKQVISGPKDQVPSNASFTRQLISSDPKLQSKAFVKLVRVVPDHSLPALSQKTSVSTERIEKAENKSAPPNPSSAQPSTSSSKGEY